MDCSPPTQNIVHTHRLLALAGIMVMALGQVCILWRNPLIPGFTLGEQLNIQYRIELPNANNVLIGSLLLALGALLVLPSTRMLWLFAEHAPLNIENTPRDQQATQRLIRVAAVLLAIVLWAVTFVVIVPFGLLLAFHDGLQWGKLRHIRQQGAAE